MTAGIIIGIIVFALITIYRHKSSPSPTYYSSPVPLIADQTILDSAVSFGYKCVWFAIKTGNKNKVAKILELKNVSDCNWQVGIDKAYKGSVFITPTVNGWTLVCGWGLPLADPTKKNFDEVKNILKTLSKEFGEAQYFCTYRIEEYHCWMKALNGQVKRIYSYWGSNGIILVEGQPTEFEQSLKLANTISDENYFERENIVWDRPNEDLVMKIAEHWSIDPTKLEERKDIPLILGLLGER